MSVVHRCLLLATLAGCHHAAPPKRVEPRVTVTTAVAIRGDQPLYRDGLGTVTAWNTTLIRSRVDGPLTAVGFHEGQYVHANDILAVVDKRTFTASVEQAKAQLRKDTAALASARSDLAEFEAAKSALPAQQVEHGRAAVDEAASTVAVDRANLASLELSLAFCDIRSPIDGVIGLRAVDVGNIVHATDTNGIAVVTQVKPIAVVFTLPQDQLPDVLTATRAGPVTAEIYDRDLQRQLATGTLLAVDNQIDPATGTARFKVEVANADGALFPNQFVNVRVRVGTTHDIVLAPSAAIQRGPDGSLVYVVGPDQRIVVRPVVAGVAEHGLTVIASGLSPGDRVVTAGADKLDRGTLVTLDRTSS